MHYTGVVACLGTLFVVADVVQWCFRRKTSPMGIIGCALLAVDWILYLGAFALQDYTLRPVCETSSRGLPLALRVASSWSTSGGSLFLLTAVLALVTLSWRRKPATLRVGHELFVVAFSVLSFLCGAFESSPGVAAGIGLNPLLRSPWMYPHPLLTFASYALILSSTVFAYHDEEGYVTLAKIGWLLLTLGIVTGGYWSYITLGWGGYWAWDPVETAELTSWVSLTLALHLRLLDRDLSRASLMMTAGSVFLASLVARVGISPLHSFASSRGIAGLSLLVLSLAFVLYGLRSTGRAKIRGARSAEGIGLLLSCFSLFTMFLLLFFILISASIGSLLGFNFVFPEMDSGARFFSLTLLPFVLVLLTSIFLYTAGNLLSWRGIKISLGLLLSLTAILSLMVAAGYLVWSPESPLIVNLMTFAVLPLSIAGLISGIAVILTRLRSSSVRSFLLHIALLLVVIGFVLSWPFAYEQSYFKEADLQAGRKVLIDGAKVELRGYRYEVSKESMYLSTDYIQPEISERASSAMDALSTNFSRIFLAYLRGKRLLSESGVLEFYEATREGLKLGGTYRSPAEVEVNSTNITCLEVSLSNPRITSFVEYGGERITLRTVVGGEVRLSHAPGWILNGQTRTIHLKFLEPLSIRMGKGTLEISEAMLRIPEKSLISKGVLSANSTMTVEDGCYLGKERLELPVREEGGAIASYFRVVQDRVLLDAVKLAEESKLSDILANRTTGIGGPSGLLNFKALPEEARLLSTMEVDGETTSAMMRFDVNGEVQGIHGLVPSVIVVKRGVDDLYIVLNPPILKDKSWSIGFHALMVYYLNKSFERLNETQRLALTSLLTSAYLGDSVPAGELPFYILDLYHMALNFTEEGNVHIRAKVVPCMSLLEAGIILMVVVEIWQVIRDVKCFLSRERGP